MLEGHVQVAIAAMDNPGLKSQLSNPYRREFQMQENSLTNNNNNNKSEKKEKKQT